MTGTKSLNTELVWRAGVRVALVIFLISPFLIWLGWISEWSWPAAGEWMPIVLQSARQAVLSAVFSLLAGFMLFAAAQGWSSPRAIKIAEAALLLPNMVPALFLILSLLSWVTPWMAFPFGVGAVVFAHVLVNSGLAAISLDRVVQSRLSGMAETAWTLGASRWLFWTRVGWPAVRADVACIFLFLFGVCFTSFSIPLILGGESMATLEVAIYQTIRMDGRWDKAVILAGIQAIFLLGLAWMLPQPFWPPRPQRSHLPYFSWRQLRVLVFVPAIFVMLGWLSGIRSLMREAWPADLPLAAAILSSAALGLAVGVLHLILFLIVAFVSPHSGLNRFLNGYLAPSPAITGFALVLLPLENETADFCKLCVALTLISFPLLYRWIVHSALSTLEQQVQTARTLGASWSMILFEIVWPQLAPQVLRACGLAALWASADFAVSAIVDGQLNSLPLLMNDLLGNYRIEAAQLLMFPLLATGLGLYILFTGASRYVSR